MITAIGLYLCSPVLALGGLRIERDLHLRPTNRSLPTPKRHGSINGSRRKGADITNSDRKPRRDIYREITDQIVTLLERGGRPWPMAPAMERKPSRWQCPPAAPEQQYLSEIAQWRRPRLELRWDVPETVAEASLVS